MVHDVSTMIRSVVVNYDYQFVFFGREQSPPTPGFIIVDQPPHHVNIMYINEWAASTPLPPAPFNSNESNAT